MNVRVIIEVLCCANTNVTQSVTLSTYVTPLEVWLLELACYRLLGILRALECQSVC